MHQESLRDETKQLNVLGLVTDYLIQIEVMINKIKYTVLKLNFQINIYKIHCL